MRSLAGRAAPAAKLLGLFLVLAWPAGLLAWIAISLPDEPSEIAVEVESVWADPVEVRVDTETPVEIVLVRSEAQQLLSPGWQDVVSRVDVSVGDIVDSFDVVAVVGTRPVVAVATDEPFTRNLSANDRGSDVAMLQTLLSEVGFYPSENIDGVFGAATGRAVKEWRESIGDQSAGRSFERNQVLWLGAGPMRVASVEIVAGRVAPAADAPVFVGEHPFERGTIVIPQTTQDAAIEEGYSLLVDERFDLGNAKKAELTELQLTELSRLLADGVVTVLPPAPTSTSVGPVSNESRLSAEFVINEPEMAVAVPGSSVLSGPNGGACVFEGTDSSGSVLSVEVVGGELGVVFLDPSSAPTQSVLVNPIDVSPELKCV